MAGSGESRKGAAGGGAGGRARRGVCARRSAGTEAALVPASRPAVSITCMSAMCRPIKSASSAFASGTRGRTQAERAAWGRVNAGSLN